MNCSRRNGWRSGRASLRGPQAAPVVQGRHTIRVNSGGHKEVFSVLRTITSVSTLKNIGILVFDIDINNLFKGIVDPVNAVTQGNTLIVDDKGELMYDGEHVDGQETQKQQKNAQLLLQKATAPNGHFQITLDGLDVLAVYRVSQKTYWTTIVSIPLDRILSPVEKNRNRIDFHYPVDYCIRARRCHFYFPCTDQTAEIDGPSDEAGAARQSGCLAASEI